MGKDHWRTGRGWGRRLAIGAALLVAGAAVLFFAVLWGATTRFDAKIRAYKNQGEPILPEDFVQRQVAEAQNAALVYQRAADAHTAGLTAEERQAFDRDFTGDFPLTDTQRELIRSTLAKSAEPLRLLRVARGMPEMSWDSKFVSPVSQTLMSGPYQQRFTAMRTSANLLRAAALDAFDRGDHAAGVEYLSDIAAVARATDRMPPTLVVHMMANGIDAVAAETVLDVAPDLRADAARPARQLIDVLFDDGTRRKGFAAAWRGERMARADGVRTLSGGNFGGILIKLDGVRLLEQADGAIAAAAAISLPSARAMLPPRPSPRGLGQTLRPLSSSMWSSTDHAMVSEAKSTVLRRAAATALALRLYALDHGGTFPPQLADLVSTHLPRIPMDPFLSLGGELVYRPAGNDPKFYSVGLNGVDNGGSEQPAPGNSTVRSRWDGMDYVFHLKRRPKPATQEVESP